MKDALQRAVAVSLVILLSLLSVNLTAEAALPRPAECRDGHRSRTTPAHSTASVQLACLSALQRWKASEADALAVPPSNRPDALDAYLGGREIEALRTESLKEMQADIGRAEARILQLGGNFRAATQITTRWIQRQPGRGMPAAYLERIVAAADAILLENNTLQEHYDRRDALNRHFDEQIDRLLTREG